METKTRYCEFRSNHSSTQLAVKLMRSTCIRYPDGCGYFKIKALCLACTVYVEERINLNQRMHCSTCGAEARCKDFWSIIGDA